jgi:hypothetical protein
LQLFASSRKLQESIAPPLHGGGQGSNPLGFTHKYADLQEKLKDGRECS